MMAWRFSTRMSRNRAMSACSSRPSELSGFSRAYSRPSCQPRITLTEAGWKTGWTRGGREAARATATQGADARPEDDQTRRAPQTDVAARAAAQLERQPVQG